MMHVIVGLFFVALGIWGIFDEWYYVLDCLKGGGALLLTLGGLVAMVAGTIRPRPVLTTVEDDEPSEAR